jgi:hypothetical protein
MQSLKASQSSLSLKAGRRVPRACRPVTVRAASDDLWYPGAARPAYLDGSLAGDRGFDPLALGADPVALKWSVGCFCADGAWTNVTKSTARMLG